jgi:hypothetical protein
MRTSENFSSRTFLNEGKKKGQGYADFREHTFQALR